MARIRTIKPEFWESEQVASVPLDHRLLFIGLISNADDEGRLRGRPQLVKSAVFPYDDIAPKKVDAMLENLENAGLIRRYTVAGQSYIDIPTFNDHQRINRPSPSRLPAWEHRDMQDNPDNHGALTEDSVSNHGALTHTSHPEGNGRERNNVNEPELVHRVFDHWVKATRRDPHRTQLTSDRRRLIATRLRTYPADDLIAAIDGCVADDWHQGANDRGKKYDDLALILRDAAHIEKFRDATTPTDEWQISDDERQRIIAELQARNAAD